MLLPSGLRSLALVALAAAVPAWSQDGAPPPPSPLPEPESVLMLRLRDGSIRWGAIVEHSPDGFRFQSLDDGGLADLTWPLLDPSQAQELRAELGYVDVSAEELYVDGERLLLVDGREVSGVILSREGDHYVVKSDGQMQLVPKVRVESVTRGERLPALDVYTREELYGMFAAEAELDDPLAQAALARRCEQILDFEHAVAHYRAALELSSEDERPELAFALERAERKAVQQAQVDYLREVDALRKREKYDQALAQLAAFPALFPDSPLGEDARKAAERTLLARDVALRELVRRRWDYWARRLARSTAGELTHQQAVDFAQSGLGELVRKQVFEDVRARITQDVREEDVERIWAARKKSAYKTASYGYGTWLLGEERANAGTERKEEVEKVGLDAEREKLEEKIKRFVESQRAQRRTQTDQEAEEEHESFWRSLAASARGNWIHAYYVEFSGDFELRSHPTLLSCPGCARTGVREVLSVGGGGSASKQGGKGSNAGLLLLTCGTCHGSGILRRVYYR